MDGLPHPRPSTPVPTAGERARTRWGIDRVRLLHQSDGGEEADLARALQRHLRHLPVVMFHDRLLPGGALAEFIAVGPGGITAIARAGRLAGPLRVERLRGMFGAYAELLRDGTAADRTALLAPVAARVTAVRLLVGDDAPVGGALCLGSDDGPEVLRPLMVGDLHVGSPRAVASFCAREGRLTDTEVAVLVDALDATCPSALY
jgi:hypothetical protein